jgi:Ca2+-binding RTX toxin-like protein
VSGGAGNDSIDGGAGDDALAGEDGNDNLKGGDGRDVLLGGAGADQLSGGGGEDTADYATSTVDLSISLDNAANDGAAGEGDNVRSDVENVTTGSGNDVVTGSAADNVLVSGDGDDTVNGGGGDDVIHGGFGIDRTFGQDGDDFFTSRSGNSEGTDPADADLIDGGGGFDYAQEDLVDNSLSIEFITDCVHLDDGHDTPSSVRGGGAGAAGAKAGGLASLLPTLTPPTLSGGLLAVVGSSGNDRIVVDQTSTAIVLTLTTPFGSLSRSFSLSSVVAIEVDAGEGDDVVDLGDTNRRSTIDGGSGNDNLAGGIGNDLFYCGEGLGNDGTDVLRGKAGNDKADYSARTANLNINLDNAANDGATNVPGGEQDNVMGDIEYVFAGFGDDTITGQAADDLLFGGPGRDTISGGGGGDYMVGSVGADFLIGGANYDFLILDDGTGERYNGATGQDLLDIDAADVFQGL